MPKDIKDFQTIEVPFKVNVQQKWLKLNIKEDFRSKAWAAWFGQIQYALRKKKFYDDVFEAVEINFSNCKWADPMPLLSLILSIREYKNSGGYTSIILPDIQAETGHYSETNRLLKFLAQEGFLKLLIDHSGEVRNTKEKILYEQIKNFENLPPQLFFENSKLLPSEIIETRKIDIEQWVDEKIGKFSHILGQKVPAWVIDDLFTRIKLFLVETLENVAKHAYDETDTLGYAGVYIRYREGLNIGNCNEKTEEHRKILKKTIKKEEENNPRLLLEFIEDRPGGVEIFIIDSGVGICKTLEDSLKKHEKKLSKPFPVACKLVFIDGERRSDKKQMNRTKSGGLYFIGQSMMINKDFIYGRDHDSWIGTYLPFEDPSVTDIHILNYSENNCKISVGGLAWLARLSWIQETEKIRKFFYTWDKGKANNHPVFEEFKHDRMNFDSIQNLYFEDYRFSESQEFYIDYVIPNNRQKYFFLIPSERHSKAKIWEIIQSYSDKILFFANQTLIIADINFHEMDTYINALHKSEFNDCNKTFVKKFSKIILVTKRLAVSVLKRISGKNQFGYEYDKDATISFYNGNKSDQFEPDKKLKDTLSWLRKHDSLLFWETIKNNENRDQILIKGSIKWDEDIVLDEYLNFVQTLPDPVCIRIFRIALERTAGFFREGKCKFKNMDLLTNRLCSELNSKLFPYYDGKNIVNMGSVLVSGYTQSEVDFDDKPIDNAVNVHFFKNSKTINDICYLLLWPKSEWLEKHFETERRDYERVGKTHVIAKKGDKYFMMPRYINKKILAYKRSPNETYIDIQKKFPRLAKIGHSNYEGFHDLLILNFIDIVGTSFKTRGDLAIFLLSEFFFALGGKNSNDLSDLGKKWWDEIEKCKQPDYEKKEVALIVYLSHSHTDFIIEEIKKYLSPRLNEKVHPFIPIINHRDGSSLLISPLVFETIIKGIKKYKLQKMKRNASILIFDDTIISGRTRKELKHILFHLGAKEVKTLTILDRQRLPLNSPDIKRHTAYWRIDFPRLGTKDICPICNSLNIVKNFKNDLISDNAKDRLDKWIKIWKSTSPLAATSEHGIESTPVTLKNPHKTFGIENSGKVEIKTSLGLTLYVTEIHAMTSKNDLALRYCQTEDITPETKIKILTSQLLLFGTEFSKAMHQDMLKIIFESANQMNEADSHTALAGLVLILQKDYFIKNLITDLINDKNFTEDQINNIDISLVLAYHITHTSNPKMKSDLQKISRMLKGNTDIKALYNQFHSEIYDLHGEIHSKPLGLLVKDISKITLSQKSQAHNLMSISFNRLEDSLNSISLLKFILKNIPDSYFLKIQEKITIKQLKKETIADLDNKYSIINNKIKDIKKSQADNIVKIFNELLKELKVTLENLKKMHSFLFIKAGKSNWTIEKKLPIIIEIESILNSLKNWNGEKLSKFLHKVCINEKKAKFPDNTNNELWIFWDKNLANELKYLISNVRHSEGKIKNPFIDFSDEKDEKADMWIDIIFHDEDLEICLANKSKMSSKDIESRVEKNRRWEQEHIMNLGGSLEFSQKIIDKFYIIYTHIRIPYLL